jgi:glycosyltransferase involved in cell wall biosynthesis
MKILYLTVGGSIHDYRFLTKLVERGYETCYAYLHPKGSAYVIPGVKPCYLGYDVAEDDNQFIKMVARFRSYWNFQRLLKKFKPDILHAGFVQSAGLMAAVSGYHPFLLMPWGSDILLNPYRNKIFKMLTKYVLSRADFITCDAEEVKRRIIELANYPAEKIIVFPWGIDLKLFRPCVELRKATRQELGWEDKKILIMTRSFKEVYGIEYFLKALPKVFEEVPEARALVIGSGPLELQLKALAQELNLADRIRFLGEIPNHELPKYLNASDLYVSSSLSDGTSLSLLEALACGLPVVVTDVPANLEWVEDGINGLVVPRQSSEELAKAVITLLKDEQYAQEMGKKNLALARKRADWDRNFAKLEELYQRMVSLKVR